MTCLRNVLEQNDIGDLLSEILLLSGRFSKSGLIFSMYIQFHTHTYAYTHTCSHTLARAHTQTRIHTCTLAHTHTNTQICSHIINILWICI